MGTSIRIDNLFFRNHLADSVAGGCVHFVPVGNWQVLDEGGRRKYVSAVERRRFLEVVNKRDPTLRALAYVLAFSGCRISEALELTAHQVDVEDCRLVFRTLKRRRLIFRAVPVPRSVIQQLDAIITGDSGHFWTMHRSTAYRHIKQAMSDAGIDGPMACCRGLRHGYGILAASSHVPQNLITKWMGHADGTTTSIYIDAVGLEEREFAKRMWSSPN